MKLSNILKEIILVFIIGVVFTSFINFFMPVLATDSMEKLNIEKISNPDAGEGDTDGIENGGDRETSYAWAMAARGDYIYIGTNKNMLGDVVQATADIMGIAGLTEDIVWSIVNRMTNGEIPRPAFDGGSIYKCNIKTGEIKKIFTVGEGEAFRMAIEFKGDIYFGSYSAKSSANKYIYKIDQNDDITVAFKSTAGTSMRAACIHNEELYFGGVDARQELAEGDEEYVKMGIVKKDNNDDTKWERVADYKDFYEYANNMAIKNFVMSPIWDLCSYNGYIYVTIPNSVGIVMYKGHPAEEGEKANEYGWCWTEVIGRNSKENNIGLADTPEGHIGEEKWLITMAATPFVFNEELYLMSCDNTITSVMSAWIGRLVAQSNVINRRLNMNVYLKPVYTTLNNPQKLWKYNDETGKFNEVEGIKKFLEGNCNEYLWRSEVYNDELYITTMDSAVLYNWVIKLKGDDFTTMKEKDLDTVVTNINEYISTFKSSTEANLQNAQMVELLEQTANMLNEYKTVMEDNISFNDFVVKYEDLFIKLEVMEEVINNLEETENESLDTAIDDLKLFYSQIDISGLRMYAYIVKTVGSEEKWGFDMIKTADGKDFELVTDSGFGDKYNYGGRSLVATDAGLFVGTANPFYGAQLWRVSEEENIKENPEDNPNDDFNDDSTDKNEDEEKVEPDDEGKVEPDDEGKVEPDDDTITKEELPKTGKVSIILMIITLLTIGIVKHIQYRKIDVR